LFDSSYFSWNSARSKGIVDFYSYKWFYFKKIADLGAGYGDIGGVLYRLGADMTAVDARQDHLKIIKKKYTGIKTVQANLDATWPFYGQKFDLILDLGLLCHLSGYEAHLKAACASTTHLVLETAVCDSDDPQKCLEIDEGRNTYDLAYNGNGCRPSPAAIERVLKECGMNFKRMDNSKFNAVDYVYDWYPKNDNSSNLQKRRIWFCVKENSPVQFANPASEIAYSPVIIPPSQGFITPIKNTGILAARSRPPMSARMEAEAKAKAAGIEIITAPVPSPIRSHKGPSSLNDKVKSDSRKFSLITPDDFAAPVTTQMSAVISTNTVSSRMWYKKIAPLLPNLRLTQNMLSMSGFAKTDKSADVIMCSLDNLQVYNRIWIDEWFSPELTDEHIAILQKCNIIITPSLLNAQEIWKHIPHANITRVAKPWPLFAVTPAEGSYYLYFEKSEALTNLLFDAWDETYGNLVVAGSSLKTPPYATFVSDSESYTQIMKLLMGAHALIDLSENNFYASGLLKLATSVNLPVLTNNHITMNPNTTIIQQDKAASLYPTTEHIKAAINKFANSAKSKATFNENYNQLVLEDVRKITGI